MIRTLVFLIACCLALPLAAQDRHEGYYYPPVTSTEVFDRVIRETDRASKVARIDFVQSLTQSQLSAPEAPQFIFFAKGEDARDLIVVALNDDVFASLYRARAVMAQVTVNVRQGSFFVEQNLQFVATFYDLLQILEFDTLVLSDGTSWAHKVTFDRNQ